MVDRTRTHWGNFRPFILFGSSTMTLTPRHRRRPGRATVTLLEDTQHNLPITPHTHPRIRLYEVPTVFVSLPSPTT